MNWTAVAEWGAFVCVAGVFALLGYLYSRWGDD